MYIQGTLVYIQMYPWKEVCIHGLCILLDSVSFHLMCKLLHNWILENRPYYHAKNKFTCLSICNFHKHVLLKHFLPLNIINSKWSVIDLSTNLTSKTICIWKVLNKININNIKCDSMVYFQNQSTNSYI